MPISPVTPESKKSSTGSPEPRISMDLLRNRTHLEPHSNGTSACDTELPECVDDEVDVGTGRALCARGQAPDPILTRVCIRHVRAPVRPTSDSQTRQGPSRVPGYREWPRTRMPVIQVGRSQLPPSESVRPPPSGCLTVERRPSTWPRPCPISQSQR